MRCFASLFLACALLPIATSQDKKQRDKKGPTPRVFYAMPLVAKAGEKQKITLRGKNLAAVKEVKVTGAEGAKVKFLNAKSVGVPNNYPGDRVGDSEVQIELELPKDVKPGEVKLTASNASGESNPYTLLLRTDLRAVAEKEDNGSFNAAQPITVPCAVEGTIRGERDVDVFKFDGKKGDKLVIEVQAARFGSPTDGFLTIYDADHKILTSADDIDGSADPVLSITLPKDGIYFIALLDAHDLGGDNFGYRLVVKKAD